MDGGSSFTQATCPLAIADKTVEAICPEAFARPKSHLFPCAPRYSSALVDDDRHPTARWECALRRDVTQSITKLHIEQWIRSCFYPRERFTLERARNTIELSRVQKAYREYSTLTSHCQEGILPS